ncbi:MAG: type II secretion system GspH family protein [Candidatus Eremiobacteraeota bacterium]|nr:type II secretion system GspH family protein [Candidatus Eremiobacteraeota bacterium]
MILKRKCSGMTLLEIVVTVLVFSVFSLIVTMLVISALRNYTRGQMMQDVRLKTNTAMRMMVDDIGKAYTLQTLGAGTWVPSGVILPNPYGDIGITGDDGNGKSTDRLIVVIPSVDTFTIDITDPVGEGQMRFVEYIVQSGDKKVLFRNVYTVAISGGSYNGYGRSGEKWMPVGGLYLPSSANPSDRLVELPGINDTITFTVERPELNPRDPSYNVDYDRHLYELWVKMIEYYRDDINRAVRYEEKTQAKSTVK